MDQYKEIVGKSSLKDLLNKAYSTIGNSKIKIVLGNPSCDQDSFIGSHILAAMLGRIPVVNLCRDIFQCKHDLVKVCEIMGIKPENLVFLVKEGGIYSLRYKEKTYKVKEKEISACLIDFNLPDKDLLSDNFTVDRIIDHHPVIEYKEKVHSKVTGMEIELSAGSCSSLIYRFISNKFKKELEEKKETPFYSFLLLLTIPIMTDTSLLESRVHDVDKNGVNSLLSVASIPFDKAAAVHKELHKLKKCEDRIETRLILQMDYKSFDFPAEFSGKTFGISSVKYPYDDWVKRDGNEKWKSAVKEFSAKKGHEFFLINCKTKGKREFYIHNPPSDDFIKNGIYQGAPIQKRNVLNDSEIVVYNVDCTNSRKIIAPIIFKYLSDSKASSKE